MNVMCLLVMYITSNEEEDGGGCVGGDGDSDGMNVTSVKVIFMLSSTESRRPSICVPYRISTTTCLSTSACNKTTSVRGKRLFIILDFEREGERQRGGMPAISTKQRARNLKLKYIIYIYICIFFQVRESTIVSCAEKI